MGLHFVRRLEKVKIINMHSRSILNLGSRAVNFLQKRNKSVQNWKRPSMDEYPVPTESWSVVQARTNKKNNLVLASGVITFALTIAYCWQSDYTVFYGVPRHLIDLENDRLLTNFEEPQKQKWSGFVVCIFD